MKTYFKTYFGQPIIVQLLNPLNTIHRRTSLSASLGLQFTGKNSHAESSGIRVEEKVMRRALTALGLYAGLCMPGQVCCTGIWIGGPADGSRPGHVQNVCGTLEQFERFATIACLQSKAVENPSTALAIRLVGRCMAAKMTADKVNNAQISNERNHEEALKAQKELREMGAQP